MGNDHSIEKIEPKDFPPLLREIDDPPKELYFRGSMPPDNFVYLCVVGSRRYSAYGKDVCERLISDLRNHPVVVVSGLALGIDAIAHQSALDAELKTVAVPGSGLDWEVLHPKTNHHIAKRILESGGALVTEYPEDTKPAQWTFPQRNRIMVGMSHATLVVEAEEKSGTLISARLAMEYNRDVLAVPGSVFSANTKGVHALIRDGATPITSTDDLLDALGFEKENSIVQTQDLTEKEKQVIELLHEPLSRDELIRNLDIPVHKANVLLSTMELKGLIVETLGKIRVK